MGRKTANRQSMTTKQAAQAFAVGERSIYKAKIVRRARPDLAVQIADGELSLDAAHRIVTDQKKRTGWNKLWAAWQAASVHDKARLVAFIQDMMEE